uniref:Uncharacterized protein n=1 Tax=Toxoplasma gondii (strain ATCC 50861 / VEG) TaxID=432359 RepID=A0A0F7V4K6_TOXGV|nr:TPA: hypothetical protein BN1205_021280 [Toxoplasma gondii VEG]
MEKTVFLRVFHTLSWQPRMHCPEAARDEFCESEESEGGRGCQRAAVFRLKFCCVCVASPPCHRVRVSSKLEVSGIRKITCASGTFERKDREHSQPPHLNAVKHKRTPHH